MAVDKVFLLRALKSAKTFAPEQSCKSGVTMSKSAEEFQSIIDANSNIPVKLQDSLTHRHMLLLAECYENWANTEPNVDQEHAAQLLGWAKGMKDLAWLVGEEWSPPEPERLCLTGFLARELEA